ncbi:glycolate oxidase subunit GlcD1 [methanogenic archaeon ISO4-H5]|nr:glycolate oxidase subunit GlcD1 [methanogenic archaeon ISO4-H5]
MIRLTELPGDSPYTIDECKIRGRADEVIIPVNEAEVIEAVRTCSSITISGMRTGMCGGSVPYEGSVLSMERFNKILGVGKDDRGFFVRVQPFVTVRQLNDFLRKRVFDDVSDITEGAIAEMKSRPEGFFYPVDPTELNGSLGGNIAANASGPRTYKYGPTRNWVRRIRAVLSDGSVLDITRGDIHAEGRTISIPFADGKRSFTLPSYQFNTAVKNTAGLFVEDNMDAMDLFVGSEGVFGIITEADLYVIPAYPLISSIVFLPNDGDAYALSRDFANSGVTPEFLEFFDSGSLNLIRSSRRDDPRFTEMPDIPEDAGSALFFDLPIDDNLKENFRRLEHVIAKHGGSLGNSWCGYELKDRQRFFAFRHAVPQSIFDYVARLKGASAPGINKMGTDMSVPLDKLDEMMAAYDEVITRYGLEYVIFGHIGNGHPHVEIILKDMDDLERARQAYMELAAKAIELGGSPSAEHGIGKLKVDYVRMMYGDDGVEQMRAVKRAMDPKYLFNPGNIFGGEAE